jgi:hypothetical protein
MFRVLCVTTILLLAGSAAFRCEPAESAPNRYEILMRCQLTPPSLSCRPPSFGFGLQQIPSATLQAIFDDPDAPKSLSRDTEPDDFFSTNMDKMSDSEKLPLALGGLAVVSIPFIIGMVVLYGSK